MICHKKNWTSKHVKTRGNSQLLQINRKSLPLEWHAEGHRNTAVECQATLQAASVCQQATPPRCQSQYTAPVCIIFSILSRHTINQHTTNTPLHDERVGSTYIVAARGRGKYLGPVKGFIVLAPCYHRLSNAPRRARSLRLCATICPL